MIFNAERQKNIWTVQPVVLHFVSETTENELSNEYNEFFRTH